jgi:dTDP-4-amino-4,6-dideoxygalactose transaminase
MAVHVYGNACDVEAIEDIAKRHNLKVIYDGAHAFGSVYKGRSLLDYGDVATCSFHATKIFQTIEGGAVITHSPELHEKMGLLRSFGHIADEHFCLGINAKASEFQAIMGLCALDDMPSVYERRAALTTVYDRALEGLPCQRPVFSDHLAYNHAYYAVAFETPERRASVQRALNNAGIFPRRYFYPSLNTLPYVPYHSSCPISESLAQRVLCLPFYVDLAHEDAERVAGIIRQAL